MDPAELLARGFSRETTIRRNARGVWYHDGAPIERESIRRAFDRWIDRADDGRYCLKNSINWAYCEIEGPPIFVRAVFARDERLILRLSDEREERLLPETLRQAADGGLLCTVRGGRLDAGFDAAALVQLSEWLEEDESGARLHWNGQTWPLPRVD